MSKYNTSVCKTHDCLIHDESIDNLIDTLRYIESPAVKKIKGHVMFVPVEVHKIERFVIHKLRALGVKDLEAYGYDQVSIGKANLNKMVSKCHESGLMTSIGEEGTNFYECSMCGNPCDAVENMELLA